MVFTEGKNSEPDYLHGMKQLEHVHFRTYIEISRHHGTPLFLVKKAVEQARDLEVDQCWCVFDVEWPENHADLSSVLTLARESNIGVAVSNPCFELWLALHHQDCQRFLDTKEACRLSQEQDGRAGKAIDPARYLPYRQRAGTRARRLAERHRQDGKVLPYDNPSSSMYELLAVLEPNAGDLESSE